MFTRQKNHAERVLQQQWIFGGIYCKIRKCFLVRVPNRTAAILMPIIQQCINPESNIISDCWHADNGIQAARYPHQTVNHIYNFVDPDSGAHTQTVKRMWKSAKFRNKKQSETIRNFLDLYLAEHMWQSHLNGRDPFTVILKDVAAFMPHR